MTLEQIKVIVEKKLVDSLYEGLPAFLVDIRLEAEELLKIEIDHLKGLTFDYCEALNRYLADYLREKGLDFELEVGSYSVAAPFILSQHYLKNIGRLVEILTVDHQLIRANLIALEGDYALFAPEAKKKKIKNEVEEQPLRFHISQQIKQIKLILKF